MRLRVGAAYIIMGWMVLNNQQQFWIKTFGRGQHVLLVGVHVLEALVVEALQLALEVDGHLGQVLQGGAIWAGHFNWYSVTKI